MRRFLFLFLLLFSACSPSPSAVQTAIANTQAAWTPTPTSALPPTLIPTPTAPAMWTHCLLAKGMSKSFFDKLLLQETCIYGVITNKFGTESGDTVFNLYPGENRQFQLLVLEDAALQATYPGAPGLLTTAGEGECIIAVGYPRRFDTGERMFVGFDVRDLSQLTSELGSTHPLVQELAAGCK